ncbi:MAG TPA: Uma2 family endonuclease [Thermoanaerobaculia bacterium]|nr:Uma2 family endonuclease [Thermoanaerobaculia bacterium]
MAVPAPKMPADWELTPTPEEADPFRYGWRPKYVLLPGGAFEKQLVPLTAADLLDPQLGDEILVEGGPHASISTLLYELLERTFGEDPGVLVTHDMKMLWGIPGLQEPAPDVAVIRGARDKDEVREVFDVGVEEVRPCLVIEVVSPKYAEVRNNDYVDKVKIYERAGIPEYLIVEPFRVPGNPIRQWIGYRLGPDGRYRLIELDAEGRLLSETTGLLFGVSEDGFFQVTDARTCEVLRSPKQLEADEKAAKELAAREAEARLAAEERAAAAEERAAREAEARQAAEAELARLRAGLDRR